MAGHVSLTDLQTPNTPGKEKALASKRLHHISATRSTRVTLQQAKTKGFN
jgi:hypothetical protein